MSEEKNKIDYAELFQRERAEWREKIQVIGLSLKDIRTVAPAQVDLFSTRQVLIEYGFKLAQIISKLSTKERQRRAALLKEYTENRDVRYSPTDMKTLMTSDLSDLTEKMELVEGHRKYIDQTVQTVDHMLYSIKSRIALEEYLRGSTIK